MRQSCWNEEDSAAGRKVKGLLEDVLYERRLKVSDCAARLNISAERLYKYLNKNNSNNNIPAYLLPIWHRMVGPELLGHLAHEAGCVIVDSPHETEDIMEAVEAATRAMKECSEALSTFSQAVSDGTVTLREIKEITREVSEGMGALLGLQITAERLRNVKK